MNKILNINLGGYPISIDDDAYNYLSAYIESLRRKFSESDGRDEIVNDIEARLGELITESMGSRQIVMLPDVQAAIEVLGKPEDFGEPETTSASQSGTYQEKKSEGQSASNPKGPILRTGKRFFRDEQDAIVGGVCSGVAAYFGIQDPVWVRLLFVIIAFGSFGFWAFVYILLWSIIPKAETAADRLAMRGEPINVDNIAREVEERVNDFSEKVNNSYSSGTKSHNAGYNAMNLGVSIIGQVFAFVAKFIAKFGGLIILLIGMAMLLGLLLGSIGAIWGLFVGAPFLRFFSPFSAGVTWLGVFNLFFLIGIPILGIVLTVTRKMFRVRTPVWLGAGLSGFWFLNLISAGILGGIALKDNVGQGTLTSNIDIAHSSDTLRVEMLNQFTNDDQNRWQWEEGGMKINDQQAHMNGLVSIRVVRSSSNQFECSKTIHARGANNIAALENAENIGFEPVIFGNVFRVPTGFFIPQGKKWHGQEVRLTIGVPVGKCITFDKDIYHYAAADMGDYAKGAKGNYISKRPEKVFKMTDKGLMCADCGLENVTELDNDKNYENFILEGDFETEIIDSEEFSLEIIGNKDKINIIPSERDLTLVTNGKITEGSVRVVIKAPVFTSLIAEKNAQVTIRGFDEGRASITLRDGAKAKAYMDVNELTLSLSGSSFLNLSGDGENLEVSTANTAALDATSFRVDRAEISASDASQVRVYARHQAEVKADASSNVKVDGNAELSKK